MKYPKKIIRLTPFLLLFIVIFYGIFLSINKIFSADDAFDAVKSVNSKEKLDYEKRPIELIKSYLIHPSGGKLKLNDTDGKIDFSQFGQSAAVDDLLLERRNGFFVECGSASGEHLSNTLYFELKRNWTGLLVEPNPVFFRELFAKQRNAYLFTTCIGPSTTSNSFNFRMAGRLGGLSAYAIEQRKQGVEGSKGAEESKESRGSARDVPLICFPLGDVLDSMNVTHVDYLSLEVQGAEIDILKTIDFNRMDIDVISLNYFYATGDLARYQTFFDGLGTYEKVMTLPREATDITGQAVIFRRKKTLQ